MNGREPPSSTGASWFVKRISKNWWILLDLHDGTTIFVVYYVFLLLFLVGGLVFFPLFPTLPTLSRSSFRFSIFPTLPFFPNFQHFQHYLCRRMMIWIDTFHIDWLTPPEEHRFCFRWSLRTIPRGAKVLQSVFLNTGWRDYLNHFESMVPKMPRNSLAL